MTSPGCEPPRPFPLRPERQEGLGPHPASPGKPGPPFPETTVLGSRTASSGQGPLCIVPQQMCLQGPAPARGVAAGQQGHGMLVCLCPLRTRASWPSNTSAKPKTPPLSATAGLGVPSPPPPAFRAHIWGAQLNTALQECPPQMAMECTPPCHPAPTRVHGQPACRRQGRKLRAWRVSGQQGSGTVRPSRGDPPTQGGPGARTHPSFAHAGRALGLHRRPLPRPGGRSPPLRPSPHPCTVLLDLSLASTSLSPPHRTSSGAAPWPWWLLSPQNVSLLCT